MDGRAETAQTEATGPKEAHHEQSVTFHLLSALLQVCMRCRSRVGPLRSGPLASPHHPVQPRPGRPDHSASREETIAGFSRLLGWSGGGLLLVFLAFALVDALPLALHIEPTNGFLRAKLAIARQWAIVVVFAFLLLVPLQGFATWRLLSPAALSLPLGELKRSLLDELQKTETRASGRISGPALTLLQQLIRQLEFLRGRRPRGNRRAP